MSTQQKQESTITNRQIHNRLTRLSITHQLNIEEFIAYIGLQLVSKGNVVPFSKAIRVVKQSKLDKKIKANSAIPCNNFTEALIHLVIYKRKLLKFFFENEELEIWNNEVTAPIFDLMFEISKVYKI